MYPPPAPARLITPVSVVLFLSIPCALFFGLVAVTAHPLLIGFSVALILGSAFLIRPEWIAWLILILGLLVTGILPLYIHEGFAARSAWSVSILGFFFAGRGFPEAVLNTGHISGNPRFYMDRAAVLCLCGLVHICKLAFCG